MHRVAIGADSGMGIFEIVSGAAQIQSPNCFIRLDLAFDQAFDGDGAHVGFESRRAPTDEIAGGAQAHEQATADERGGEN